MATNITQETDTAKTATREHMQIVIGGHVDHGKSTIIGRLLADTGSLPEGKLEEIRERCARNSKPFEYAFLLDAFKDEQSQGITIDAARVFFQTPKRSYIIIDAPGHIEFLKNMVSGASRAEAALLVIDADEGVQENSRRHGYMLSMLGINQIAVLVNKMDLVDYDEQVFRRIVDEYTEFLHDIGVEPACFVPVSGIEGENIADRNGKTPWYEGSTVLDVLDEFRKEPPPLDKPFRMPVQDVYKFTSKGDKRRIVAGTVTTGRLRVGDEVVFYPSGKHSKVRSIEAFNRPPVEETSAGWAAGFTLDEQIYVTRGEIACRADEAKPKVATRIRASLFWMGKDPMVKGREYILKAGTAKIPVELEEIVRLIDASDLKANPEKESIERHDVAECVLKMRRAAAFDLASEVAAISRFVIVDNYEIRGGGIIREDLPDEQAWAREHVIMRNAEWETSMISRDERSEKFNQRATLILVTGGKDVGKKAIAKGIEARLFRDGKIVYFMSISNVLYGVDADIKVKGSTAHRREHLRRLAEVANIMLDAGIILVVTAVGLTHDEVELMQTSIGPEMMELIWVGPDAPSDVEFDMLAPDAENIDDTLDTVKTLLQDKGIIFKP